MKLHILKWYEWIILAILFAAGFLLIEIQREFILLPWRFFTSPVIIIIIVTLFFVIVRPAKPYSLSRLLSLVLGAVTLAMILTMHVIVRFDFSLRYMTLFAYALSVPFLSGWLLVLMKGEGNG